MSGIKVFAPASVANIAVGYDILGLALDRPGDDLIVRKGSKDGLSISKITKGKGLPTEVEKNTAGMAAKKLLEFLGESKRPIEIELHKNMALGTGLGSSAASAVAGAFGVNTYLGSPLSKSEILQFAVAGEQVADGAWHADNVAPSLFGGIILIRDNASLDWKRVYVPEGLRIVLISPHIRILTRESRAILKAEISLENHISQSGNLASFIAAMYTSDFNLLRRSLKDHIIEPQRKKLIPHFDDLKNLAMAEGALGFSISGAGPTMFALCENTFIAENIVEKSRAFYKNKKLGHTVFQSGINLQGAIKY